MSPNGVPKDLIFFAFIIASRNTNNLKADLKHSKPFAAGIKSLQLRPPLFSQPPPNVRTFDPLIIEAQREIANSNENITVYHTCKPPPCTYLMARGRIYGNSSARSRTKMRVESGLLPRGTTRKILISHYLSAAYVLLAYFALTALYLARAGDGGGSRNLT